ncbi:hypothetical protein X962_5674 [Burkholderia pseudomallei MSHR7343]|nr:hypothetical protein X962_5674 [Burkholderia pseudomallei MSHR7343]
MHENCPIKKDRRRGGGPRKGDRGPLLRTSASSPISAPIRHLTGLQRPRSAWLNSNERPAAIMPCSAPIQAQPQWACTTSQVPIEVSARLTGAPPP